MKNKLLVSACAVAMMASMFTSCKQKVDFDAIADGVSEKTLQGYFSGAEVFGDALVMNVVQYNFAEDGSVERTTMEIGDGVYKAPASKKYSSWSFGDYFEGDKGRYLTLNAADGTEPLKLKYCFGGIMEDAQPAALDKNDKIASIPSTNADVLGKKWYGNDTTYYKIDTIVDVRRLDTIYTYTPKKDPETGKYMKDSTGHIIYEQTIKEIKESFIPTKMKWPIAPKTIDIRCIELYRDSTTLANTGKWYMLSKAYDMNEKRITKLTKDTTASYDFHWTYYTYSSSSAFVIEAVQDNGTVEFFECGYDFKLPSVTIDKQVLKVKE